MNKLLPVAVILAALGGANVRAQTPPAYNVADLILVFDDPTGTDLEFNLGLASALPADGTVDFGNVASLLTANGQSLSSAEWSVAAGFTGEIKGGATETVATSAGAVTVLPNALWLTQNNASTPSFVGTPSASSTPVNTAIATVGSDIEAQTAALGASGIAKSGVAVSATGDPDSYSNQGNYAEVSLNLETTGVGSSNLWLLTATTPGTTGKSGTNEGPFDGAYDLGTFTLSNTGELTFTSAAPAGGGTTTTGSRLVNISSRAGVGTGADIEIAGFVISGPAGSTEQVLIRAIGPSLTQYGVTGVLAQPVLTLFDAAGNELSTNTGWGTSADAAAIVTASADVGAFALAAGSADSVLLLTLAPGAYTAQVTGAAGTTGVALAEVYEVAAGSAALANISSRALVGTGANVEIGGFAVTGTQDRSMLIRAVGPTLTQFGVTGVLAQPTLTVVDAAGNTVATNTGWSNSANADAVAAAATAAGAFALPAGSADSALLLSLAPGNYTALVSGVNGSSGVVLAEIYAE